MKKIIVLSITFIFSIVFFVTAVSAQCVKIQSGQVFTSNGVQVSTGYDVYGYNYQAHMFNGLSANASRPPTPVTSGSEKLIMKWSDEWLSNKSCDGNALLDRGLDASTGIATGSSKGWITNHYEGDYLDVAGDSHHYTYFVKIVWVGPAPTLPTQDPWAAKRIWGEFAIIEEVYNDPDGGFHGIDRSELVNPGLGFYTN